MHEVKFAIDEEKLGSRITDELVSQGISTLESEIFGEGRYSMLRRMYKEDLQAEVRKMLKSHEKEIIDRDVTEARVRIVKKGLPQFLEQHLEV